MEVHEPVYLVHGETTPLAPGMCFSDEPGIYIPGQVRRPDRGLLAHDRERPEILHPAAAEHRPPVRLMLEVVVDRAGRVPHVTAACGGSMSAGSSGSSIAFPARDDGRGDRIADDVGR